VITHLLNKPLKEYSYTINTGQTNDDGHIAWNASPPTDYSGANGIRMGGEAGKVTGSYVGFFRFPNITIPQGAIITSATFFVGYASWSSGTPDGVIRFKMEDADDVATGDANLFVMDDTIWNATLTTAYTDHTLSAANINIDVTTTVQEIINRASWASGNAMRLQGRVQTANSEGLVGFRYYSHASRGKLTIEAEY
jgi:hypothetical protein